MRVMTKDQRSEAWKDARRGRVTASNINAVLAGPNTKTRRKYIDSIILDLEGVEDFADSAPYFELGRKHEPYAIGWYQYETSRNVKSTGFVLHDTYNWLGSSPDGLVGRVGMIEAKFRVSLRTFHDACIKPIPRAYLYQMQANMWVCNRKWCDFINYWRSVDGKKEQGHVRRVVRDDALIKEIEAASLVFWRDLVREYHKQTGKDVISFPVPPPQPKTKRRAKKAR